MSDKNNVYLSYEKIAEWFDQHRSRDLFEKSYLDLAISYLSPKAKILDLGCGMDEPIAQYFIAQGFNLTGVDGSAKLIHLAGQRYPQARFIVNDMRDLNLNEKFDLIIAWHSFFHLTPTDQRKMFDVFTKHLNSGGVLLFTSGPKAGEVWGDNGGENLYHASLDPEEYIKILQDHHFKLITYKIEDPDCGGASVWAAQLNT